MSAWPVPVQAFGRLAQSKIAPEVITLLVFVPFAMLHMQQPFKPDDLWAGLCVVAIVNFISRA